MQRFEQLAIFEGYLISSHISQEINVLWKIESLDKLSAVFFFFFFLSGAFWVIWNPVGGVVREQFAVIYQASVQ